MKNEELVRNLKDILANVHSRFEYVSDQKLFGVEEYWYTPDVSPGEIIRGDCEDFAFACRELCRQRGITNTRIIVCTVKKGAQRGGGHAVLYVDGYILDNRFKSLMTVRRLNSEYNWIAASGYEHCDPWRRIEGVKFE